MTRLTLFSNKIKNNVKNSPFLIGFSFSRLYCDVNVVIQWYLFPIVNTIQFHSRYDPRGKERYCAEKDTVLRILELFQIYIVDECYFVKPSCTAGQFYLRHLQVSYLVLVPTIICIAFHKLCNFSHNAVMIQHSE